MDRKHFLANEICSLLPLFSAGWLASDVNMI